MGNLNYSFAALKSLSKISPVSAWLSVRRSTEGGAARGISPRLLNTVAWKVLLMAVYEIDAQ